MGGHGGLNILPQKSWHVYNQDNREKVARDEAKFEKEQAEKREQHRQAESQYRHAALLARARQQPLQESIMLASEQQPAAIEEAPATDAAAPSEPRVKHDIMATKRAVQQADGHFNFWKEEELRAGNAEVKDDKLQERRRRGDPETQTSDARFDERFKLGHAMHGKGNTPWYAVPGAAALPRVDTPDTRGLDGGKLLAAASGETPRVPGGAAPQEGASKKHKHQDKKHKRKPRVKDSKTKVSAKQLKASVQAMRAEREAREAAERAREKQLLRLTFRG